MVCDSQRGKKFNLIAEKHVYVHNLGGAGVHGHWKQKQSEINTIEESFCRLHLPSRIKAADKVTFKWKNRQLHPNTTMQNPERTYVEPINTARSSCARPL